MRDIAWLVVMALEMVWAATKAGNGDVAGTILYCFSAYVCLQFLTKGGKSDG